MKYKIIKAYRSNNNKKSSKTPFHILVRKFQSHDLHLTKYFPIINYYSMLLYTKTEYFCIK